MSQEDALDAVAVVRETIIYDTLSDLVGGAELPAASATVPRIMAATKRPSHRKVAIEFVSFLDRESSARGSCVWTTAELRDAFSRSGLICSRPTSDDFIQALNQVTLS